MTNSYFQKGLAITPSDSDVFSPATMAVYIGTGGDLTVIFDGDDTPTTFKNVAGGVMFPYHVKQIMATNTTASDITIVWGV